jgi:hypothetical protein
MSDESTLRKEKEVSYENSLYIYKDKKSHLLEECNFADL